MLSLHKLTAGTGYDYLTRQVAAMDSTEKGHTTLADYYDQKGETPGHWVGSGLTGIDGLKAGDVVTADQMLSLFGLGDHPLATQRLAALDASATERDISRAGDPDLHTHVAFANKVQSPDDGVWRSIDGRTLFKANVTISEFYNTALEQHLTRELGVRFVSRPGCNPERPVREIEGLEPALLAHWSQRDKVITRRHEHLAADFQRRYGRTPTPAEQHDLAQRATLETRQKKHEPRSLAEQRRAPDSTSRAGRCAA